MSAELDTLQYLVGLPIGVQVCPAFGKDQKDELQWFYGCNVGWEAAGAGDWYVYVRSADGLLAYGPSSLLETCRAVISDYEHKVFVPAARSAGAQRVLDSLPSRQQRVTAPAVLSKPIPTKTWRLF